MYLNSRFEYNCVFKAVISVIFEVYIFSRIFKKREIRENIYSAKIYTFTVYYPTTSEGDTRPDLSKVGNRVSAT